MTSQDTQRTDAPGRLLRRRTDDRVIGGVAGGIGDYFNVDPLLIRIGFVGLIIFGGAGLVLYFVAWLLVPAEGSDVSPVEGVLGRLGLTPRRLGWIAAVIVAIILLSSFPIGGPFDGSGYMYVGPLSIDPIAFWSVAVIAAGYLLIRRRETSPATAGVAATAAMTAPPRAPVVRRPPSPLAWYVCAALLIAVGGLALVSQIGRVEVNPGQFFGAALTVMGIGLVIGTWWGRARILILSAVLLMPVAIVSSFVTAPLEGGIGVPRFTPANVAEVRDEYRILAGTLTLDLTELSVGRRPVTIAGSVAIGKLVVILPRDASIELRGRAGAGQVMIFSEYNVGTGVDDTYVRHHQYGTTYILDLEVGIGEVLVINDIGDDF